MESEDYAGNEPSEDSRWIPGVLRHRPGPTIARDGSRLNVGRFAFYGTTELAIRTRKGSILGTLPVRGQVKTVRSARQLLPSYSSEVVGSR